jgi:hypothetical protein
LLLIPSPLCRQKIQNIQRIQKIQEGSAAFFDRAAFFNAINFVGDPLRF